MTDEKVSLEWLKDKEKMKNLTEEQMTELSNLYIEDILSQEYECLNCGRKTTGKKMFALDPQGKGYFCSYACYKGKTKRIWRKRQ